MFAFRWGIVSLLEQHTGDEIGDENTNEKESNEISRNIPEAKDGKGEVNQCSKGETRGATRRTVIRLPPKDADTDQDGVDANEESVEIVLR